MNGTVGFSQGGGTQGGGTQGGSTREYAGRGQAPPLLYYGWHSPSCIALESKLALLGQAPYEGRKDKL